MIDTEKLRALLAAATPLPGRDPATSDVAALIAAAVNALPELLDAVDRLRAVEIAARGVMLARDWDMNAPDDDVEKLGEAIAAHLEATPDATPTTDGKAWCASSRLATAEAERDELRAEVTLTAADAANVRAERLTLARALELLADDAAKYGPEDFDLDGFNAPLDLAARIVAEADAAAAAKETT